MSFLERQQKAFAAGLGKLGDSKRPPPSPSPSVTSTTSTPAPGTAVNTTPKQPKREPVGVIYSQPENTGPGEELGSNILYIVDYLKKEGRPRTLTDILAYTNLNKRDELFQQKINSSLREHTRIKYIPDPEAAASLPAGQAWRAGKFEHQPIIPGVKNGESLIRYLQRRTETTGVSVKDIKDGWPDCEDEIVRLEVEHRLLVVRTKKDNQARMVWINDPTLCHDVDQEFKLMWRKVEVPPVDDIVRRLTQVGQKPTSEDPRLKVPVNTEKKKQKKKVQRRAGKRTNTHMEHLLKATEQLKK